MTVSCCLCRSSQSELWAVSNTDAAPLKYIPFYVCDGHLQHRPELKDAFYQVCKARFEKIKDNRIESDEWILEKQVSTWKKNDSYECCECERTDQIWRKTKHGIDKDDSYPTTDYKYICDGHLSRKNNITPLGPDLHTMEDTW